MGRGIGIAVGIEEAEGEGWTGYSSASAGTAGSGDIATAGSDSAVDGASLSMGDGVVEVTG